MAVLGKELADGDVLLLGREHLGGYAGSSARCLACFRWSYRLHEKKFLMVERTPLGVARLGGAPNPRRSGLFRHVQPSAPAVERALLMLFIGNGGTPA